MNMDSVNQETSQTTEVNTATPAPQVEATPQANTAPQIDFSAIMSAIPEEYRSVLEKNGVKDLETLGKSYKGLVHLKGQKGLIPPRENATDEEKTAFKSELHKLIGVPDAEKGYEYTLSENIKADYVNDDFVNELANIAYENGVSNTAFEKIVNTMYEAYTQEKDEMLAEIESLKAKLGQEGSMELPSTNQEPSDYKEAGRKALQNYYILLSQGKKIEAEEQKKLANQYYDKAYK